MTVQIAVKLDDGLAEQVKAAAEDAGTNLSEWVRSALQYQAAVAKARRARAEEDARGPVYTAEQETALMTARRRRAIAALDEQ
ncbi:MAG: hypothetical protein QOH09_4820 [Pseudonocardiales bacterium]|jgi:hypothetical protein|nr:ribbon-helix-helix protein CopG family [Pseudonocardiales bacterium]MDT7718828.1 hypothetical protein [Pseudonocardiales bacterium]